MNRYFVLAALLAAAPLCAGLPKNGDLLPRNDIIFYATSDRPDTAYRLFGKNEKGEWRLKAWPYEMIAKDAAKEGADPEQEKQQRAIADFMFASLDATASMEMGLLDVTLGGGKFLLVLRAREGAAFNARPDFLKELVKEELKIRDIGVVVYEIKNERKAEGRERGIEVPGFDRFYVAAIEGGLVVTNFESSMHDVIERFVTRDYSESLSSRPEFATWRDTRKPHDLSFFIVGKEIQKAVERMLPDDKMDGGHDVSGAYNEADRWLQLREYQSIVVDFDYDEARSGFGIDAKLTTRRKTRLLEQLAISPAEFKLLRYLPADAMLSAGVQLGDAAMTWERFVEFARDGEKIAHRAMDRKESPLPPPKDEREKDETGNAPDGEKPGEVEKTLKEIDEQLAKFGTSLKEVLAALGSEAIGHVTADTARALKNGARGFGDLLEYSHMGLIIGIKDAKSAKAVLDKVRNGGDPNKDTFTTASHGGFELNVNARQGWAYVLTADAVLLTFTRPQLEDGAAHLEAGLKRMIDASKATFTGDAKFLSPSSKFINVNVGAMVGAYSEMSKTLAEKLDRYAEPQMDDTATWFKTTTVSMRTVEDTMSVEVGLRIWGLPNFIDAFGGLVGSRQGSPRDAYRYSQGTLRDVGSALQSYVVRNSGQPTMAGLLKADGLRAAHFQTPFDARWQGGYEHLAWFGLNEMRPDKDGKLPEWVNKDAAALVEANEKLGFNSFTLVESNVRGWVQEQKAGFIVLYQTEAQAFGGHLVLYADGQVGWLSAKVLKDALALNAKGDAVPGEDRWSKSEKRSEKPAPSKGDPDDPWAPK